MANSGAAFNDPRPVVVGLDGSADAEIALWWAAGFASSTERPLRLLSTYALPTIIGVGAAAGYVPAVVNSDDVKKVDAETHKYIDDLKSKVLKVYPGLYMESWIDQGSAEAALVKASEECSLVVVGTHGVGATHALVLGSTSYAVAHHAKCPVALIPSSADPATSGRVVVGIDGSSHSDQAAHWAADMSIALKRPLRLVTAWHYPYAALTSTLAPVSGPDFETVRSAMLRDASELVDRTRKNLEATHTGVSEVDANLYEGSSTEGLVENTGVADIVVVGARSHSVLASVLLGGTAISVAHRSRGAVIIVR